MTQQQCSPFTPPGHRNKSAIGGYGRHTRGITTVSSNVMLSTLGSIGLDERDIVEMEEMHLEIGMDLGSLSTAVGGDDGEPIPEGDSQSGTPAPAYHSLEMGFRGGLTHPSLDESRFRGIRVDVEKATSTM